MEGNIDATKTRHLLIEFLIGFILQHSRLQPVQQELSASTNNWDPAITPLSVTDPTVLDGHPL